MIPIKILNQNEKKEIEKQLGEQFGIKKIPDNLLKTGKERFVIFTGDLNIFKKIEEMTNIEGVGVYFGKIADASNQIRLSIEGTQIMKEQITKNIFELNESEAEKWMHGQQLEISLGKREFVIIRHKDDFLGTGKASEEKIGNFIPKNRRLKNKET
jgi:NOL1/NOP2/fmu family ribosome biogenesis protein